VRLAAADSNSTAGGDGDGGADAECNGVRAATSAADARGSGGQPG
jgi:hypothetical protein